MNPSQLKGTCSGRNCFAALSQIINEEINPIHHQSQHEFEKTLSTKVESIGYLIKSLLDSFYFDIENMENEKMIEDKICVHHDILSSQLDALFSFQRTLENQKWDRSILIIQDIHMLMIELINTQRKFFRESIEKKSKAPILYKIRKAQEIHRIKKDLISKMQNSRCWNLIQIAIKPLLQFELNHQTKHYTYKEVENHVVLIQQLDKFMTDEMDCEEKLINFLISINLNTSIFLSYLISQIEQELEICSNPIEAQQKLFYFKKNISQIIQTQKIYLYANKENIKNQLLKWIDKEMEFQVKQQEYAKEDKIKQVKIPIELSVAQLACLLKLFSAIGVFSIKHDDLINRISQVFSTKKSPSISSKSLQSKFYNIEENTQLFIREILLKALDLIRKRNGLFFH